MSGCSAVLPRFNFRFPCSWVTRSPRHKPFSSLPLYKQSLWSNPKGKLPPTMFKKNLVSLPLLLTTFLLFNQVKAISSPVFRRPASLEESSHPNLDSLKNLPPNARLIAAGLPPLPPSKGWAPTETEDSEFCLHLPAWEPLLTHDSSQL